MIRNDTERGVTCYFKFENVLVFGRHNRQDNKTRLLSAIGHSSDYYAATKAGLRLARICAGEVGKDNVVTYTETRHANGDITATGLVRNPMGF